MITLMVRQSYGGVLLDQVKFQTLPREGDRIHINGERYHVDRIEWASSHREQDGVLVYRPTVVVS